MADTSFDILIIGSGPGGYVSAIRAAQLGFKTAIVERDYLGGICLNWGCIPTKALLRSAEIFHYMQHAKDYGLKADNVGYDAAAVVKRSRAVAKRLNDGVGFLMKKNKVVGDLGRGGDRRARQGHGEGRRRPKRRRARSVPASYQAKHIIIATGARPRVLPGLEPDKKLVWTYFEAMVPPAIPKSLLVIGSGAIGIEFASFFRKLGAEVTVVEVLPQILPVEDHEIAGLRPQELREAGHQDSHQRQSHQARQEGRQRHRHHRRGRQDADDHRRARHLRRRRHRQYREPRPGKARREDRARHHRRSTSSTRPTSPASTPSATSPARRCWRTRPSTRASSASRRSRACNPHPMNKLMIPGCTYCTPQIASVGLTEQAAKEKKLDIRVGRFPFVGNGKAIALGEDQGLVKVIFDKKTGQLLGAHMVGAEVTELIQGYVVAMNLETTEEELMHTVFPHPTLSEMMKEAVLDAYGRVLNM